MCSFPTQQGRNVDPPQQQQQQQQLGTTTKKTKTPNKSQFTASSRTDVLLGRHGMQLQITVMDLEPGVGEFRNTALINCYHSCTQSVFQTGLWKKHAGDERWLFLMGSSLMVCFLVLKQKWAQPERYQSQEFSGLEACVWDRGQSSVTFKLKQLKCLSCRPGYGYIYLYLSDHLQRSHGNSAGCVKTETELIMHFLIYDVIMTAYITGFLSVWFRTTITKTRWRCPEGGQMSEWWIRMSP